ncbi:MAG: hypothetical protein JW984_13290 [Deltaproteobacteria bacterium]|uniref:Uncharacterized protein n=1 Tax=Candidatus Zymogenus saltonus TaxID=2844893 RepID=A0A9D8KFL8_9DELT|nr:hypothetical protein [Candidatus Zymogenus saltonus]
MKNRAVKAIGRSAVLRSAVLISFFLILSLALFPLAGSAVAAGEKGKAPDMPNTDITIPWDEFKALIEKFFEEEPTPPTPPPVELSVKEAKYTADLSPDLITVNADLDVITFGEGWRELRVIGDGASLVSLTVDGKYAPTKTKGDSVYVYLKGNGAESKRYNVGARFYVFAPKTPGPHSVTFSVPEAAVGTIAMGYDRKLENVGINGIVTSRSAGRVNGVLRGEGAIKIDYTVSAPTEEREAVRKSKPEESIVLSEVMTVMDVEEEALFVDAVVDFEVRGAPTTSFEIGFPDYLELIDVTGEGVSGWELNEKKNGLKVRIGYEVVGNYSLTLSFEKDFPEGTKEIEFPKIVPLSVKRDAGYLAVVSGGGFEISEGKYAKIAPQDPSELPSKLLNLKGLSPVLSYRYTNPNWLLALNVEKGELLPVLSANADSANGVGVVTADGKMVLRTHFYIRNRNLQYLKITIPEGGEFWSARLKGRPLKVSVDSEKKILVPLPLTVERNAEPFLVETVIFVPVDESDTLGRILIELPTLNIPVSEMMLTLYLPERNDYVLFGGDMEEIEYFERILEEKDTSSAFYQKNIKLRRDVYERQQMLEDVINKDESIAPDSSTGEDVSSQFQIPLRGEIHRFVKLIVISEKSHVTANYVNGRLMGGIKLAVFLALAIALFIGGRRFVREMGIRLKKS